MVIKKNTGNNISKQNSRFDILNHEHNNNNNKNNNKNISKNTPHNTNTKTNKTQNKNNMFTNPNYIYDEKDDQEDQYIHDENIEMSIPEVNLGLDQFPELGNNNQNNKKTQQNKEYLEKLRQQKSNNNQTIDKDLENLDIGWVLLKRNKDDRKTIFKEHLNTPKHNTFPLEKTETETVIINNVFEQLVNNHEIKTQEYIYNWGYDEWEQTFKFHNWREEEQFWNDDDYITDDDNSLCSDDYMDDY
jgi:hypothetical protein